MHPHRPTNSDLNNVALSQPNAVADWLTHPSRSGRGCLFQTFVAAELRTCGMLLPICTGLPVSRKDIGALYSVASRNRHATASGKVVVRENSAITVFQTDAAGNAEPVWCGNAIAAAAAAMGDGPIRFTACGPGGLFVGVSATTYCPGDRFHVAQSWSISLGRAVQEMWRGRRVVLLNALNAYAIVEGPLPPGVTPEQARCDLVGNTLAAKLAIVTQGLDGSTVEFFNAAGAHGAAPLTGLATLSLAALQCRWLHNSFPGRRLVYRGPSGPIANILPKAVVSRDGLLIEMPAVTVGLDAIGLTNTKEHAT